VANLFRCDGCRNVATSPAEGPELRVTFSYCDSLRDGTPPRSSLLDSLKLDLCADCVHEKDVSASIASALAWASDDRRAQR
jgi:hypothetical protein